MANSSRNLLADSVRDCLAQYLFDPSLTKFVVAYSGGVDSRVLLQLCHELQLDLRAIHINHQLQAKADEWQQHCTEVCDQLGIEIDCIRVDAEASRGDSPEAAARDARYTALLDAMQDDEVLLLAQHSDDQAETVLLQLLRGAGAAGLAAMPQCSERSNTQGNNFKVLRPLLACTREQLLAFAMENNLKWVEDPSNSDTAYRRNAVRHKLMPQLREFEPAIVQQLNKVATQQQSSACLLDELARMDLEHCTTEQADQLNTGLLAGFSAERQFNLLRFWLSEQGARPNRDCIEQILKNLMGAAADATPIVRWGRHEVRRFDNRLYLMLQSGSEHVQASYSWLPGQSELLLPAGRSLAIEQNITAGLDNRYLDEELQVSFRQGGERIRLHGKQHHQELKKLLQAERVPPWERDRLPLLYFEDELLAAGSEWLSAAHCSPDGETGWRPVTRK